MLHYNFHVVTNLVDAIQEPTAVMVSDIAGMVQMKVTVSIHIMLLYDIVLAHACYSTCTIHG